MTARARQRQCTNSARGRIPGTTRERVAFPPIQS
jgi:hypothetical protein